jgi:hypothetical protein
MFVSAICTNATASVLLEAWLAGCSINGRREHCTQTNSSTAALEKKEILFGLFFSQEYLAS